MVTPFNLGQHTEDLMTTAPAGAFDGVFDDVAGEYDSEGVVFFRPLAQRLIEHLNPRPGHTILDVGCGRGAVTFPLAQAVAPAGSVVGIDLSPNMIRAIAADAVARNLGNVTFAQMDGAAPDYSPQSFDAITGSMSIVMMPDLPKAFANYAVLLRPGGTLAFSAPDTRNQQGAWRTGPIDIGRLAAEIPSDVLAGRPMLARLIEGNLLDLARIPGDLARAGFADAREFREEITVVADSPAGVVRWTQQHGMRAVWDAVPSGRRAAVEEEMLAEATRQADADGRLTFGFPVTIFVATASPPASEEPSSS
jgi:O-methyltransferase/aklanonic acid methyltransferase